ncbi:hypothetical protein OAD54_01475 [Candidatus Pelagibacter sp.]|nr:hypothetical protein [Candidatus Pelagibacter sp.]
MSEIKLFKKDLKKNNKGNVLKFIEISTEFKKITEVYFSEIKKNKIKGWKKNLTSSQFIYVVKGAIQIVLYNDLAKISKKINIFKIGEKKIYSKIIIPKKYWYSFKGLTKDNLIVNALSIKHKDCKMVSEDLENNTIPYSWK